MAKQQFNLALLFPQTTKKTTSKPVTKKAMIKPKVTKKK